ncbi:MAG: hypothetical protein AAGE52_38045 [Myxococcota bacterium]
MLRLVLVLSVAVSLPAAAQDETQTAAARALFQQGLAFADSGEWEQAADRFERALELRWAAPIAFNLADSEVHLGRLVEASEHLRSVGSGEGSAEVKAAAAELLSEITPRLAQLEIVVVGSTEGVDFVLNERPLPAAMVGVAFPANPSVHQVVARRGERVVGRGSVSLTEGETRQLTIRLGEAASGADVPTPEELAAQTPVEETPRHSPAKAIVYASVAAVVVIAVIVIAVVVAGGGGSKLDGDFDPSRLEGEGEPL